MSNLYKSVTGTSNIFNVSVRQNHDSSTAMALIQAEDTSLGIGDSIEVDIGYVGDHAKLFAGYVKQIDRQAKDDIYTITAYDEMVRASDFFIVSSGPDNPYIQRNVYAEDLVEYVLGLAGITSFTAEATNFILGTNTNLEINLVNCYDYCNTIASVLAWNLWADTSGTIHFERRRPYPEGGDTPVASLTDSDILQITHVKSDRDLRNRVVVWGTGVSAEASASSPYLPSGYYKTVVLSTEKIDNQGYAQDSADYNLEMLNRLTEILNVSVVGNVDYTARNTINIECDTISLTDAEWYIYSSEHSIGKEGYKVNMELRK